MVRLKLHNLILIRFIDYIIIVLVIFIIISYVFTSIVCLPTKSCILIRPIFVINIARKNNGCVNGEVVQYKKCMIIMNVYKRYNS